MDVKYISADWERMKSALKNVVGAGWGTGTIDELIKMNKNLEKAESDIAKYDSDGVISFTHLDRERTYKGLDEDFNVLYQFTNKVGNIVDRTIDQPFYEDMDAFVAKIQEISILDQKTKNRIGAITTVHVQGYQSMEVEKQEVTMEDLLNGDNFYSKQMKLEYEAWKEMNVDQEITQEEYQTAALNTRAFGYESIKDSQLNKEFWVNIAAVVVIVGAALICPPAGIALGAVYGTAELSSAISGKDWVSGRELDTGERVFRGVLAPIDILPAASAFRSFSGVARTSRLGNGVKDLGINIKTGMKNVETKVVQINDAVVTATQQGAMRIKNANAVVKERVKEIPNKLADRAVDAAKVVDETYTNTKTVFSKIGLREELAFDGGVVRQSAENTHTVENMVTKIVDRVPGVNIGGSGGARGASKNVHRSEIDEVIKSDYDINGNLVNRSMVPKGYESVEDFLKVVDDKTIKEFGYDSIEEFKAVIGYVEDFLNASPKNNIVNKGLAGGAHVKGVEYDVLGFPIFKGDDLKFSLKLEENLFRATDNNQFKECTKVLKEAIEQGDIPKDLFTAKQLRDIENGEARIKGLTWHHHQVPGKMQLVITKTHRVNHLGGNKLWGDGIR